MVEQGSEEWKRMRAGKFTGSRFVDVLARNKKNGKPLKCYDDLLWDLAVERLTGEPIEGPDGYALRWGKDVEPFAREAYELETGNLVEEVEFIGHPQYSFAGCSPDGLIDDDGGVELKSPKSSRVHLIRFTEGVPDEYIPQVQGCMWVTGRAWWSFASYDPRMPESHRLFHRVVERDDAFISRLEEAVLEAEERVKALLDSINGKAA